MLPKAILYSYSQKVYSCRGIKKLLRENIPAIWLAMQQPDFRTLNDFLGVRIRVFKDELFETMIQKLLADIYITKVEELRGQMDKITRQEIRDLCATKS